MTLDVTRLKASQQLVANTLANCSLDTLGPVIGKDGPATSRIRSNQLGITLEQTVVLLNAAGLKIVPIDARCFKPGFVEYVKAIETLVQHLQSAGHRPSFEVDDA